MVQIWIKFDKARSHMCLEGEENGEVENNLNLG